MQRFNALADHIVRPENFADQGRPDQAAGHAAGVNDPEPDPRHHRPLAGIGGENRDALRCVGPRRPLRNARRRRWQPVHQVVLGKKIIPGAGALPGALADLFATYASALRSEFAAQVAAGITDPRRRTGKSVRVDYAEGPQLLSHEAFLARYMAVRRNTLHGYDLSREDQRQFLAIHDGRLPVRFPDGDGCRQWLSSPTQAPTLSDGSSRPNPAVNARRLPAGITDRD